VGTFYDAWARHASKDGERAMAELRRGFALCYEVGVLNWVAQMIVMQAGAEGDAGRIEDGLATIGGFLTEAQPIKQRWLDAELHRLRGTLLLRRAPAEPESAEAAFKEALAIARRQETRIFELRAAVVLAKLWRDQGRLKEARDLLAPVYGQFSQGFDTADLKAAKAQLDALAS